jgi:hypothetical protein
MAILSELRTVAVQICDFLEKSQIWTFAGSVCTRIIQLRLIEQGFFRKIVS